MGRLAPMTPKMEIEFTFQVDGRMLHGTTTGMTHRCRCRVADLCIPSSNSAPSGALASYQVSARVIALIVMTWVRSYRLAELIKVVSQYHGRLDTVRDIWDKYTHQNVKEYQDFLLVDRKDTSELQSLV